MNVSGARPETSWPDLARVTAGAGIRVTRPVESATHRSGRSGRCRMRDHAEPVATAKSSVAALGERSPYGVVAAASTIAESVSASQDGHVAGDRIVRFAVGR